MVKFLSALLLLFAASCQAPMAGSDCMDCTEQCTDCAEAMACEACAAGEECTDCDAGAVAASMMVAELEECEGGECCAEGEGMKECCAEMGAEACSDSAKEACSDEAAEACSDSDKEACTEEGN